MLVFVGVCTYTCLKFQEQWSTVDTNQQRLLGFSYINFWWQYLLRSDSWSDYTKGHTSSLSLPLPSEDRPGWIADFGSGSVEHESAMNPLRYLLNFIYLMKSSEWWKCAINSTPSSQVKGQTFLDVGNAHTHRIPECSHIFRNILFPKESTTGRLRQIGI